MEIDPGVIDILGVFACVFGMIVVPAALIAWVGAAIHWCLNLGDKPDPLDLLRGQNAARDAAFARAGAVDAALRGWEDIPLLKFKD